DGSLKQFWEERFANLPDNAAIVDLATGNGALALLAAEYSREHDKSFRITGIDYANIQPEALQQRHPLLEEIRFLVNTSMEATGLASASQDLIMSQFGFEYGDMPAASREVRRLLKPGGCFHAMIHHENSAILAQAREALAQIKRCDKSAVAETATALVKLQQRLAREGKLSAAEQQHAKQLHQALSHSLEKLRRYAQQLKDPSHVRMFTQSIMLLFDRRNARSITPEQRLQTIQRLMAENQSYKQRMKDLRSAAYSPADFRKLEKNLKQLGFSEPSVQPQEYAGQHFCHTISACLNNSDLPL
ncbi:class I SAM-dependent methyltransferase, partial [Thiolapillus sp.]